MTGDGLYVFIQAIYSDFGHGLLLVPHDSYRETTSQNFRFWQEFRALERTSPTFRYLGIRAQSDEAMTAVQRQMKDHSDELWKLLQSQNSHLYISGKGLEEASSDWLMISKCIEFILIIYIYISSYIFYPLGKCHHYSWFRCFFWEVLRQLRWVLSRSCFGAATKLDPTAPHDATAGALPLWLVTYGETVAVQAVRSAPWFAVCRRQKSGISMDSL